MTRADPANRYPVVVVIPTRNSRRWIRDCLTSIGTLDPAPAAVVVVDNGSSDGTQLEVAHVSPATELIELPTNVGYGTAVNLGAARHPDLHVLALNVDTVVGPDGLDLLMARLEEDERTAVVAPALFNADGSPQPSVQAFPTLRALWAQAIGLDRFGRWKNRPRLGARGERVEWVTGAALLIRRSAFDEVGGFDPAYHFYVEDLDLQRRLVTAGWSVVFEPEAHVVHHGGHRVVPAQQFSWLHDGFERYFGRHHGRRQQVLGRVALIAVASTRLIAWSVMALLPARRSDSKAWMAMYGGGVRHSLAALPGAIRRSHDAAAR